MSRRMIVLGNCGHWWHESQPEGFQLTSPRVCMGKHAGALAQFVIRRSAQGLDEVEVAYVDPVWAERAIDTSGLRDLRYTTNGAPDLMAALRASLTRAREAVSGGLRERLAAALDNAVPAARMRGVREVFIAWLHDEADKRREPGDPDAMAYRRIEANVLDLMAKRLADTLNPEGDTAVNREEIECPREKTWMTPCIARDGATALAGEPPSDCVGCGWPPRAVLLDLGERFAPALEELSRRRSAAEHANALPALVSAYVQSLNPKETPE